MCFLLSAGHDSEIAIKWQWARWVAGRRSKCASVVNLVYMFVHIYKRRGCCHYRSATTTANYAPNAVPPVIAAASVVVLISASKQPRHFNSLLGRIFTAANTQMLNSSQLNLTKLWSSVVILVCLCVCMCVCVWGCSCCCRNIHQMPAVVCQLLALCLCECFHQNCLQIILC